MDPPVALDSLALLFADRPVLHAGRRATFLNMSGGVAIIRYWGDSHAVAVPPEAVSLQAPHRRHDGGEPSRPATSRRRGSRPRAAGRTAESGAGGGGLCHRQPQSDCYFSARPCS